MPEDNVYDLRRAQRRKATREARLLVMDKSTAWRRIKRIMARAGIAGPQATSKGLRHGFGIALIQAGAPVTVVRDLLGHADIKTAEIYLQAVGEERRALVMRAWE